MLGAWKGPSLTVRNSRTWSMINIPDHKGRFCPARSGTRKWSKSVQFGFRHLCSSQTFAKPLTRPLCSVSSQHSKLWFTDSSRRWSNFQKHTNFGCDQISTIRRLSSTLHFDQSSPWTPLSVWSYATFYRRIVSFTPNYAIFLPGIPDSMSYWLTVLHVRATSISISLPLCSTILPYLSICTICSETRFTIHLQGPPGGPDRITFTNAMLVRSQWRELVH
jgi:hypothetical protein